MAVLFLVTIFVLTCLHASEAGAVELKIQGGNPRYATVGANITFTCTCILSGDDIGKDILVRWLFNNKPLTRPVCDDKNFTDHWNDTHKVCSLTIDPVKEISGGVYVCRVLSLGSKEYNATVLLHVIDHPSMIPSITRIDDSSVERRDATLHLLDPATGAVLDDPEYGTVCVQSDTTRRFECSIQDARPGVWTFKWILGNQTIATKRQARSGGAGLVNVSSWHIVKNPGNETRERNLTCLATSSDQSLNITVLITFCAESEYVKTVLRVLVSICVTATIATIITHILLCKYYEYI